MAKGIYKMNLNFGRMGDLDGIFVAEHEDLKELIESKKEIYFGEVLGKHSEVFCPIEWGDLQLVTEDVNFIKLFEEYNLTSGYNPFEYIGDEDDEDYDEEEEE